MTRYEVRCRRSPVGIRYCFVVDAEGMSSALKQVADMLHAQEHELSDWHVAKLGNERSWVERRAAVLAPPRLRVVK